jgi:protoporphyrinogen oxidase
VKIAIVGAGFGGMAAAWDLVRAGNQVTIFEASAQAGGLAAGFKQSEWDWSVEKYYHHWFASDEHMLGLIDELGWQDKVQFKRPFTVMNYQGKWYPFDSIPQALLFPGLGWGLRKVRFGLVGLFLRLTNRWEVLESISADAWMRKWAGDRVYEQMWEPLLIGKFGPYYKEVNMAWFWARLHARTTRLGTYQGGFQAFADEFAQKLVQTGVEIRFSTPVQHIEEGEQGGFAVTFLAGVDINRPEQQVFDQVLSTTSPQLMVRLVPEMPKRYLDGLLRLKSMGAVVMTLSLKQQVSDQGYYWYNIPKDAGYPFLAVVEHTNFIPRRFFDGNHILYCGDYLVPEHDYFTMSDDELLSVFIPGLLKLNPDFEEGWINQVWVHRTKYAQPVPLVNHSENIPDIRTPLPGLYFASMSQVYPWDRGTNFAVEIGRKAARLMMIDSRG